MWTLKIQIPTARVTSQPRFLKTRGLEWEARPPAVCRVSRPFTVGHAPPGQQVLARPFKNQDSPSEGPGPSCLGPATQGTTCESQNLSCETVSRSLEPVSAESAP